MLKLEHGWITASREKTMDRINDLISVEGTQRSNIIAVWPTVKFQNEWPIQHPFMHHPCFDKAYDYTFLVFGE